MKKYRKELFDGSLFKHREINRERVLVKKRGIFGRALVTLGDLVNGIVDIDDGMEIEYRGYAQTAINKIQSELLPLLVKSPAPCADIFYNMHKSRIKFRSKYAYNIAQLTKELTSLRELCERVSYMKDMCLADSESEKNDFSANVAVKAT